MLCIEISSPVSESSTSFLRISLSLELASLEASGATEDVYITKLEKNVPQRIRMYVWIEGQDIDCIDSTQVGRLAISLELAASNQE